MTFLGSLAMDMFRHRLAGVMTWGDSSSGKASPQGSQGGQIDVSVRLQRLVQQRAGI